MKSKIQFVAAFLVFSLVAAARPVSATAQDAQPASIEEQLKAQFITIQACGGSAADSTVLVVQKDGITAAPQSSNAPTSKYQNGTLQPSSDKLGRLRGIIPGGTNIPKTSNNQTLKNGGSVYPTQVDVGLGNDRVILGVLACDLGLKANVEFKFAKGALQKMSVPQVMDTISQVFAFDPPDDDDAGAQADAPAPDQSGPSNQAQPPQTTSIQPGQTPDEVIAALGRPDHRVASGSKLIFLYGSLNLKVTFTDGKVTDIQ